MGNLFAAGTTRAVLNEATHYIDSHPSLTNRAATTLTPRAVAVEVLIGHWARSPAVSGGLPRLRLDDALGVAREESCAVSDSGDGLGT